MARRDIRDSRDVLENSGTCVKSLVGNRTFSTFRFDTSGEGRKAFISSYGDEDDVIIDDDGGDNDGDDPGNTGDGCCCMGAAFFAAMD